jgi:hypothetical protein
VLRQLRAVLGISLLWALVWLPLGVAVALYAAARSPQPSDFISRPVSLPVFVTAWTAWGGMSGALFAVVLGLTERRHTLGELSMARTAVWGALGSMTVPAALIVIEVLRTPLALRLYDWRLPLVALAVSAVLGAGCAAATLTLARRTVA